ncbi:hypothetical protein SAMN05421810_101726 [Amycolatopsis arida]|uniref:Uncharacterized protein n=1 Tax=Amycolatopsis arida TaxID=587909 RepID=A0A1I5LZ43_9PSEU|nr:hypothetical protein [Amycolatopsis arida]TDX93902.1 hypothetical protein CLV69_104359 [Amycolatopsis arida]SFP02443.1 hypothetical protein SAMN05421810_101726 [Amycolatopsis arida]
MIHDQLIRSPFPLTGTTEKTAHDVVALVESGEDGIGDLPTPHEIHDLALLLLALAALLSPNKGDEGPIEDRATEFRQELEFAWMS